MNYSRKSVIQKKKALNSKGTKIKKMLGITFIKALLVCIISLVIIGGCMGIGAFRGILYSAPDISTIDVTPSGYATAIYDCEGHEMTKLVAADSNRTYVAMDKIPAHLAEAFIAVEDARFPYHNGIDIQGIIRAFYVGVKNRHFSEGASTITQQLIKNNVFDKWATGETFVESVKRKIQEQYLALELEKQMSKEDILELYMNTINLGQNTLGVQAASLRYFGKPVYELNISESACIASITQNPSKFNPITHPDKNAERREKVLKDMREQGYITEAEYQEAMADDVYSRIQTINTQTNSNVSVYSYFVDEVIETAAEDITEKLILDGYTESQAATLAYNMLYSGGLSIYTTQDPQIQSMCDEIYADEENFPANTQWYLNYKLTIAKANGETENHSTEMFRAYYRQENPKFNLIYPSQDAAYEAVAAYTEEMLKPGDEILAETITLTPQPQVSLTIEDQSTGYVLALIGGRGTKETSRSLNRATNTTRQPGSTFKVVSTYAPAIDSAGVNLSSVYLDAPFRYSNGRPVSNWYHSGYKGICTVRYGIEQSLNIIAVKTLTQITPQLGYDYLINFGFTTLVDRRVQPDGAVLSDITQALALGGITDGVTNMELNGAYAAIANGGIYKEPILYTKIVDHDGNVLIDKIADQDVHRVIKETTAFLLTDAMVDVVTKGTGGSVNFGGMAIAGKTGTTSDNKDVWFAGFTPYYTATTWTGYDNNVPMNDTASKNLSKTLWKTVMKKLHEDLPAENFIMPPGITTTTICRRSGKLPVEGLCDEYLKTEYFADGNLPTETCDVHYSGMVCVASGLCATENCPFKVQGTLELSPIEHPNIQSGSTSVDANGNIIPSTRRTNICPHTAEFFMNPDYETILRQQQAEVAANGFHFTLEGYVKNPVPLPEENNNEPPQAEGEQPAG